MNKPIATINEVADYYSVSVSTIRQWVREGHISRSAYFKIGNVLRFRVEEVDKCLDEVVIPHKEDWVDEEDEEPLTPEEMEVVPKLSEGQKNLAKRLGIYPDEDEEDDELDLLDNYK